MMASTSKSLWAEARLGLPGLSYLVCLLGVQVPLSSQFYNINLKLNREAFQVYSWSNPAGP